jgi:hypothetical protein
MELETIQEKIIKFMCEICKFKCSKKSEWDKHIAREKHINNTMEEDENIKKKSIKEYICEICNYKCYRKSNITDHLQSQKHLNNIKIKYHQEINNIIGNDENTKKKSRKEYICEICNYKCYKKSDMTYHLQRPKHLNILKIKSQQENNNTSYSCLNCNKIYTSKNGLWKHNNNKLKKCTEKKGSIVEPIVEPIVELQTNDNNLIMTLIKEHNDFKNIILEVVKQNQDLHKQMIDVCKNIQPSNIITNSNNKIINKTFNLQLFLNEECKDAMNIKDFMNSFQLQIKDLENVGKLGYVDGITDIIVQKLNELDIKQRPMHCSDSKRETIYIKDEGIWEKEGPANNKVKKVVGHVSKHNLNLLNSWKDLHPCCLNSNSPHNEHYLHLIKESLGGPEDMDLTESKIVKKISKEIIIDKK